MSSRQQVPKGTFDVLDGGSIGRERIEQSASRILSRAGFARIETPIFEYTELFSRSVGAATDIVSKEMYTFSDGSDRSLSLRPEGTAPVCRAFIQHGMHKRSLPVKLWYSGPFFRYEAPQAGRQRQFTQIGAETIGSDDPLADAELILLMAELLEAIGIKDSELRIGSLGTPQTRAEYRHELQAYLRSHNDQLSDDVRGRIELNPLRAFDSDHPGTKQVMVNAPRLLDRLPSDEVARFEDVKRMLDAAGIAYVVDPTLVRGLDYYTHTLWEFTSPQLGAQNALGGGGRYDGLIEQLGGNTMPGVGWAVGVERMMLAADFAVYSGSRADIYVAYDDESRRIDAFTVTTKLRRYGYHTALELQGRSLKAQLKQAGKLNADHVVILSGGSTVLKNMASGEQTEFELADVVQQVERERSAGA